jgi:putative flippase GtrA
VDIRPLPPLGASAKYLPSRDVVRQAWRFAVSGLLSTALHALLAVGIIVFLLPKPAIANGVAFVLATFFSFVMQTMWSFSSRPSRRNLARFIVVATIGLALTVLVSGTAQYLGLHYLWGIALVVCTVPPVTFLLHKFWTYR